MIHLFKTCMITAFILGLTWSAPLRAQDQRYISEPPRESWRLNFLRKR
ncbi:hypothetical protein EC133313_02305 [Escherichia coli O145:H28]|nr:hypothetical protein EC12E115_4985 [Escherichia coli O145:H28]GDH36204.1 hypothetical protein BvCmsKKP005_01855 [Escherichia coli]BCZ75331.1 hypothetical protein EC16003_4831 [Escherichia coli O145:H28]GEE24997.1 hypothetical protein EC142179_03488 [Escherichia coli O145:H28]GEE29371.1 hypothetical protein EC151733_02351 [Escherichia coli O145:H28]